MGMDEQTRRPLPPFAALRAFDAYARHGGVRRAAEALGLSHAIVSRHLRTLEAWLGTQLVDRGRRQLTAAGRTYHARISDALDRIGDASESLAKHAASRLDLCCVPGFAYLWMAGRVRAFTASHPGIALDLRPTDKAPWLVHPDADADLRFLRDGSPRADPARYRSVELHRPAMFPVASPDVAASLAGAIRSPVDLLDYPLLHEDDDGDWRAFFASHGYSVQMPPAAARLWHAHLALAAARDGQGIALTNMLLAHEDLASGRLAALVPAGGSIAMPIGTYVLTAPAERWDRPSFAGFRRWLESDIREWTLGHRRQAPPEILG